MKKFKNIYLLFLLAGIVAGFIICKISSTFLLQDVDEPPPEGEVRTCTGEFISKRVTEQEYKDLGFEPTDCDNPREIEIKEKVSIPIYYVLAGDQWTEDQVREKMDEAVTWFDQYCIRLSIYPVTLKTNETAFISQKLDKANTEGTNQYRKAINDIYEKLWMFRMGKPQKFLLIMFVNPYNEVVFDRIRDIKIAGNLQDIPIILIPSIPERNSTHIVTHELIHGLGKLWNSTKGNLVTTRAFKDSFGKRATWLEGGCSNDMGNSGRIDQSTPLNKTIDEKMDFASYVQYTKISKSVY
ncbi:MAG: hypothetical protein E3K37_16465 [Candidatus Kuenenia sp.]|nr:hypothetical protein [Candidatus Kuenenia hertensis]